MTLTVAICGDSAMWGQGLLRTSTFAHQAATRVARDLGEDLRVLPGRGAEPLRGNTRSGSQIRAVFAAPGDTSQAEEFPRTYPDLFRSDAERRDFEAGRDESPAAGLFGENPATFPTVTDAVRDFDRRDGATADLVLLNGGPNDIDFRTVLDPQGPDVEDIRAAIREVFTDRLRVLVDEARRVFPRAVIVVVGYYSALSRQTDRRRLELMATYLADKPFVLVALNDLIQRLPIAGVVNQIGGRDVEGEISTSIRRSMIGAADAQYWAQRTVAELPSSIRRPGVLFAAPAFAPANALFGPTPFLYEGYRQPDDVPAPFVDDVRVADEMLALRLGSIPRRALLPRFEGLLQMIGQWSSGAVARERATTAAADLLTDPSLTPTIRRALQRLVDDDDPRSTVEVLVPEVSRIETASIASLLHPNPAGAARIADRIAETCATHRSLSVRTVVRSLRPERGLRAQLLARGVSRFRDLAHLARITSLAFRFVGLTLSGLAVSRIDVGGTAVDGPSRAIAGSGPLFTFDTDLDLGGWSEFAVSSVGRVGFDSVEVFVNGRRRLVLDGRNPRIEGGTRVYWRAPALRASGDRPRPGRRPGRPGSSTP